MNIYSITLRDFLEQPYVHGWMHANSPYAHADVEKPISLTFNS